MLLFIPRSLCALKRVTSKSDYRFAATAGIRIATAKGLYRAEATDGRRAIVVQGSATPAVDPPWPGLKDLPDDAFETIVSPKDLERGCKVGPEHVTSLGLVGLATRGNDICLGVGDDVITARLVEGKFPPIDKVIPRIKPLFTFRVDPRLLAETLLALADLLPDGEESVQFFYYGKNAPLGFCARNADTGSLIDALVVPFSPPDDKPAPSVNGRKPKDDKAQGEANGQELDSASIKEQPAADDAPTETKEEGSPRTAGSNKKPKKVKA